LRPLGSGFSLREPRNDEFEISEPRALMALMMHLMTYDELVRGWDASIPENYTLFSIDEVPAELRPLIPYAQVFGISDDGYRWDLHGRVPRTLALHVQEAVVQHDDALRAFFEGPSTESRAVFTALFIFATEVLPDRA
jgi:hypothetical protein